MDKMIIECRDIEISVAAQKMLMQKGYRWVLAGSNRKEVIAFEVHTNGKYLSDTSPNGTKDPFAYTLEKKWHYLYLPTDQNEFNDIFEFTSPLNNVGANIRLIRKSRDLTIEELAKRVGISRVWMTRIERNDKRANPTLETLKKIAVELRARIIFAC